VGTVKFVNSKGDNVEGVLYLPSDKNLLPCPAVISIHYGLQNREALQPTAKMTAENGIALLELILRKKRNTDGKIKTFEDYTSDANAAVDYLIKNKKIDKNLIFISGHSIGGNIASIVGNRNKKIRGVIAVGYPVEFDPEAPQGVMMTAGVFDELHQASKMLSAFRKNSGNNNTTFAKYEADIVSLPAKRSNRPIGRWEMRKGKWEKDSDILFLPLTSHLSPPDIEIASSQAPRNDKNAKVLNNKELIIIKSGEIKRYIQRGKPDRVYFMSFLSDHYIEPTDPAIAGAIVEYINSYRNVIHGKDKSSGKSGNSFLYYILSILSRDILFIAVLFTFSAGFVGILHDRGFAKKIPPPLYRRICGIAVILYIIIIGLVHKKAEHLIDIYILSPVFLSLIVVNHFARKMEKRKIGQNNPDEAIGMFFRDSFKILMFIAVFYFSFIVGLYFHAGIVPYSRFDYIWRTLTGIFYLVPAQLFVFFTRINGLFLNPDWSFNFLSLTVWLILSIEIIYPGGIGLVINHFFSTIIAALQKLEFKVRLKVSIPALILLVVVLIVCGILWGQIIAEGYSLGAREIMGLAYLFLSLIIIPAVVCILLLRMRLLKKIFDKFSV